MFNNKYMSIVYCIIISTLMTHHIITLNNHSNSVNNVKWIIFMITMGISMLGGFISLTKNAVNNYLNMIFVSILLINIMKLCCNSQESDLTLTGFYIYFLFCASCSFIVNFVLVKKQ